jgi:catechol 2,3-dioxygenase-like lactoylglutathione lyase family enzyme
VSGIERATLLREQPAAALRAVVAQRRVRQLGVSMLESSDVIAFAPASDLLRARTFYEETLGLPLIEETEYACVFDAHGTMLRITATPEVARPGYTVLGWRVAEIETVVAALEAKSVVFSRYPGLDQDQLGVWTTPEGDKVAWFSDPDGNILSLTQFAEDRE